MKKLLLGLILLTIAILGIYTFKSLDVNAMFDNKKIESCEEEKPTRDTSVGDAQDWIFKCGGSIKDNKAEHTRYSNLAKEEGVKANAKREIMVMTIMDLGLNISQEYADELGLVIEGAPQEQVKDSAQ